MWGISHWLRGPERAELKAGYTGAEILFPEPVEKLRVATLNTAHAKRTGSHRLRVAADEARAVLDDGAEVLKLAGVHAAALQEADGPSIWSGRFDHVDYLARRGGFSRYVHGIHVQGLGLSYGTAVLAGPALDQALSVVFRPVLPTLSKGFVAARMPWPGRPDLSLDIVSVHLDFLRPSVRRRQVDELAGALKARGRRPLVVMGDFNSGWRDEDSAVQRTARALGLSAFEPEAAGPATYPGLGKRVDWILISDELDFSSYRTAREKLSDHRAVIAEVRLKQGG